MVTKDIKCPNCKTKVTIDAVPGEKTIVICPKCKEKGIFTLPTLNPETQQDNTIVVENLSKSFKNFKAVDNISFNVRKGDIFGFLGPNGAGKTTTISMLTTILKPNNGSAKICGYDIRKQLIEAKKRIGFMPDVPGFYGEMKAEDVLHFYAEFYRIGKDERKKKIDELFDMLKLTEFKRNKVKTYSRGMKQKLGFATALLNDPQVLILDEPTIGLDPTTIHFFRTLFSDLNEKGITIFLSSHILSEVQLLCNRVGIINRGKMIAVDTIDNLSEMITAKKSRKVIIKVEKVTDEMLQLIEKQPGVLSVETNKAKNRIEVTIGTGKNIIPKINETLVKHGIPVNSLETKEADLEDIFLSLVGDHVES